jgi:hypothetical protein
MSMSMAWSTAGSAASLPDVGAFVMAKLLR